MMHTPGPWTTGGGAGSTVAVIAREWDAPLVARVSAADRSVDEAIGNARLIAAVPDLYEYVKSSASAGCATAQKLIAEIEAAN